MNTNSSSTIHRLTIPTLALAALALSAAPARVLAQTVDPNFVVPVATFIQGFAVQPDGRIDIANQPAGVFPKRSFRLLPGGALDVVFSPDGNNSTYCTAVQLDGRVLMGGDNTTPGLRLARYLADGTQDTTFTASATQVVRWFAFQPDEKIVLGGLFDKVNGVDRYAVARLNSNGTLDTSFGNPGFLNQSFCGQIQTDGKIVVGGAFDTAGGQTHKFIARLNADGTVESTFNPTANGVVNTVAVQADGSIVIGGEFTNVNGVTRNRIARLNSDGSLDLAFNPNLSARVLTTVIQADGKFLVGGDFTTVGATARRGLARLLPTGALDTAFSLGKIDGTVLAAALQGDGRLLVSGNFITINGVGRQQVARLLNDAAIQTLSIPGSNRVQWLRGGSTPETHVVTFELSTDGGTIWTPLGAGTRIPGGWERTGVNLPATGMIRASARTPGGYFNGSSSLVQQLGAFNISPPVVTAGSASAILTAGATLNGSLNPNESATSVSFQWGLDTGYGNDTATLDAGAGNSTVPFSTTISGLMPHTIYHFRSVATNVAGTSVGDDAMFITGDSNPTPAPDVMLVVTQPQTINPLTNDTDPDGDAPLTITAVTNGARGTVTFTGTSVTYKPVNLGSGTDAFDYTVSDGFGGSAQGTVEVYSVGAEAGFYANLLEDSVEVNGQAQIILGRTGQLSGRIDLRGIKYPFKGQLDENGEASIQISRNDEARVVLQLRLLPGNTPTFEATVTDRNSAVLGAGDAMRSDTITPGKLRYTMVFPPDPTEAGSAAIPQGTGYAIMTLNKAGRIGIAGKLGDGAPFSTATSLRADGTFPFYAGLDTLPRGQIYGTLIVRDVPGVSDLDGVLTWLKKQQINPKPPQAGGFASTTAVLGSLYAIPDPLQINRMLVYNLTGDASLTFTGGGLNSQVAGLAHIGTLNPASFAPPLTRLNFTITDGRLTGRFTPPSSPGTEFRGVLLQKQNRGVGYFLTPSQSGTFTLTPTPISQP